MKKMGFSVVAGTLILVGCGGGRADDRNARDAAFQEFIDDFNLQHPYPFDQTTGDVNDPLGPWPPRAKEAGR